MQSTEAQKFLDHLAPARIYWAWMSVPFREFLLALPADKSHSSGAVEYGSQRLPQWAEKVRCSSYDAFGETTHGLDRDGRTLKAVANVETRLHSRVNQMLKQFLGRGKEVTHEQAE